MRRRTGLKRAPLRRLVPLQTKCCGKRSYATREAAERALARIQAFSERAKIPQRVYECRPGGFWHLTSQDYAPRSATVQDTGPHRTVRELVLERDDWTCFVHGGSIFEKPYSLQHRRGRGSGGSSDPAINRPSNLIAVCGSGTTGCHGWITNHPHEAELAGWAISLNSIEDPAQIAARHWRLGWVLLTDAGTYELAPQMSGGAA